MSRVILPALTSLAFLIAPFGVRAGDLETIRARQAAAKEKLTRDVNNTIERSRKMDPKDARDALQFMLREVQDSRILLESERTPLVQSLRARIAAVNNTAASKKVDDDLRPASRPPVTRPVDPPYPGGGSAAVAREWMAQPKNALSMYNQIIRDREKANLSLMLGIEKTSPIPGESGIAFPSYWKELTKRRKEMVSQQLTKQEVNLLKTLNSTMSVKYEDARFKAVLEDLRERTKLNLFVDPNSERDLNLDYDDPINFKTDKATVRTILKTILAQKGLTYIIKEGNIQVMTPERASKETVVRAYPVSDLVMPINQQAMVNPLFGPQLQQMQMMQNAQQLINVIQLTTDPQYWQPNGPGVIVFIANPPTLLIRASAEMHYQMASPGMFGR